MGEPEIAAEQPPEPQHGGSTAHPSDTHGRVTPVSNVGDVVFAQASDGIILTDDAGVVTGWNPAAERMYGISRDEAVGHLLDDLLTGTTTDGQEVRDEVRTALARHGSWRRRILQRPMIGARAGQELIIDTALTGLAQAAAGFGGIVSLNRDVTSTARLEAQLATLGSLAASTGRGRSLGEIAQNALEVLCAATAADAGMILSVDDAFEVIGRLGLSDALVDRIVGYGSIGDRLAQALERADAAVSVELEDAPVAEDIQNALREDGLATVAFAGMRVGGRLVGLLGLGWRVRTEAGPSGPVLVQAAALVGGTLQNARLLAQVEHGLAQERDLTARLQTLVELMRLPDEATDEAAIAQYLLERIVSVLGAAAGSVAQVDRGRLRPLASHNMPPALRELQETRPPSDWGFHRRFSQGWTAYVQSIEAGAVSPEILEAAGAAGFEAYAAFPIRDGDALHGVLIAGFTQPAHDLPLDERTIEAIGRVVDISFANERLRRVAMASEERYRTVFERSPDALVVQSLDDVVVDANPAAMDLYGSDVIGRHVTELADIDHADLAASQQAVLEHGGSTWTGTGRRLDGSTFPEEIESAPIRIAGEDRILTLVRDTTERQRLQQELLQAQKMEAIGLLVAGVAHELNNPLASIVAFSQLIRTDPNLPEDLRHHADLLIQESNRTRRIVQNLLDFARQRPPERLPTSLRELIDGVLALQSYTFGPSRIEPILDFPDDIPPLQLDRAQIQQVLVNLTLNAAQAIRTRAERGTIRIVARHEARDGGQLVRLSITDDGPGIPEALRSRLFVPFFTTKSPGEGTGLGLSVSFGIVAGHGGTLRYEPGPGGIGASFIVELPVDAEDAGGAGARDAPTTAELLRAGAPPPPPAPTPAAPTPTTSSTPLAADQPARVLVLDDEASIRDFLARCLRRAGYEPIVAGEGAVALEIVREDRPDAILCDHRMAGLSGTAFHDAVAEIDPNLARRFAFMSGDVLNPELRDFAVARGIVLLAKPFDIDTVGRTVEQILLA
ncbi:MAG TPA: PAS domain S-box protein [Candidatus Limnocylindrales bacterium]